MSDFDKNDANTGGKNSEPDVDAAHEAAMAYDASTTTCGTSSSSGAATCTPTPS